MGGALLKGWVKTKAYEITVVEPSGIPEYAGIQEYKDARDLPARYEPDVAVIAIKPQVLVDAMKNYGRRGWKRTVFLSIAAGKSLENLEKLLGKTARIVRAMPNLAATVQHSVTVAIANVHVGKNERKHCQALLGAIGTVRWINRENQMDTVTAVSGSGPAYLFYFQECLQKAAQEAGLDKTLAEALARETVIGSAQLLEEARESAAILRERVTSPGGTTEAALRVLMDKNSGMEQLLREAVKAATLRSSELNKN